MDNGNDQNNGQRDGYTTPPATVRQAPPPLRRRQQGGAEGHENLYLQNFFNQFHQGNPAPGAVMAAPAQPNVAGVPAAALQAALQQLTLNQQGQTQVAAAAAAAAADEDSDVEMEDVENKSTYSFK